MLKPIKMDVVQLRDERYDQIVHMLTSASGAEQFYQLANNSARTEGLELAREMDGKAAQVGGGVACVQGKRRVDTHVRRWEEEYESSVVW